MKSTRLGYFLLCASIATVGACSKHSPQNTQTERGTPEVTVVTAHQVSHPLSLETVGRLAPVRVSEVRARVAGIVLQRTYREGTDVEAGATLFRIDPATLEAELHAQEATLVKAEADAANAALTAKRYRELAAKKLLSSQDLDSAKANERTTAAAVKVAQANLEKARLNLSYATVTAPISGRAGRALVTEGALVGQNDATQLTVIEQIDPIYIDFSLPALRMQQLHTAAAAAMQQQLPVQIVLADGSLYQQTGVVDFSASTADPATATVSLRAKVANPEHQLLPGMFVNLKLALGQLDHAFLLPQATLSRDSKGAYVLVIDDEGKVVQKRVETQAMTTTDWILTGELEDQDQVILEGLQKVKPGGEAKAIPAATPEG